MTQPPVLFSADTIAARIDALADAIAPQVQPGAVLAAVMSGAFVFAADLMRALFRRGADLHFDSLHLESYGDARAPQGRVKIRSDFTRPVAGHQVWIVDDVFDSGATLAFAKSHALAQGASEVHVVALIRKPCDQPRLIVPDYVGFDAPGAFLVGYGMDDAGAGRGRPEIAAV